MLTPPLLFKIYPRVSDIVPEANGGRRKYKIGNLKRVQLRALKRRKKVLAASESSIHGINVRHPLARLVSAYRQKFEKNYYEEHEAIYRSYGKLMRYFDNKSDTILPE